MIRFMVVSVVEPRRRISGCPCYGGSNCLLLRGRSVCGEWECGALCRKVVMKTYWS